MLLTLRHAPLPLARQTAAPALLQVHLPQLLHLLHLHLLLLLLAAVP
jgi:hypothetical protein